MADYEYPLWGIDIFNHSLGKINDIQEIQKIQDSWPFNAELLSDSHRNYASFNPAWEELTFFPQMWRKNGNGESFTRWEIFHFI